MKKESTPTLSDRKAELNTLLWQVFLLAQGDTLASSSIWEYLCTFPEFKDIDFTLIDSESAARIARSHVKHGRHEPVSGGLLIKNDTYTSAAILELKSFAEAALISEETVNLEESRSKIVALFATSFTTRDYHYVGGSTVGRKTVTPESGRDKWSSFLVDFAVLKRGTHPWKYEKLHPKLKDLLSETLAFLLSTTHDEAIMHANPKRNLTLYFQRTVRQYLKQHPTLKSERPADYAKLISLNQRLLGLLKTVYA